MAGEDFRIGNTVPDFRTLGTGFPVQDNKFTGGRQQTSPGGLLRRSSFANFDDSGNIVPGSEVGGGLDFSNLGSIGTGLSGLAQLVFGAQQAKLAREQLRLSRDAYETNRTGTTKSYNTQIEGNARARASREGTSAADVDAYIKKNIIA